MALGEPHECCGPDPILGPRSVSSSQSVAASHTVSHLWAAITASTHANTQEQRLHRPMNHNGNHVDNSWLRNLSSALRMRENLFALCLESTKILQCLGGCLDHIPNTPLPSAPCGHRLRGKTSLVGAGLLPQTPRFALPECRYSSR